MGSKIKRPRPSRRLRQATTICGCFLVVYLVLFLYFPHSEYHAWRSTVSDRPSGDVLNDLSLDEAQCALHFPDLTRQVDEVVREGPFKVHQTSDDGPIQCRIHNGQMFILHAQRRADLSAEMLNSRAASLQQIHRAILTSPTRLPDTIFSLNFQDTPFGAAWAYSRAADRLHRPKDPNSRIFLMPHFSFWAWKLPFIGSMGRAAEAIAALEAQYAKPGQWQNKISKAVWRGTPWYSSVHSPRLRQNLLAVSKNMPWADVEALKWEGDGGNASNALPIEEFCRYKYVLHTEGITYSGRFQFLQMCASVVITPPLQWLQHTTHLIHPLFSSDLDLQAFRIGEVDKVARGKSRQGSNSGPKTDTRLGWQPSARVRQTWPNSPPEQANIVFVAPDWSDLEATVAWLEAHPKIAEGIARRQRELFVERGYLSSAAEACYWRALIRGWAKVARTEDEGWEDVRGTTFEAYILTNGD